MPPRELPAYVSDIVDACARVLAYAQGFDEARFLADQRTIDAVERRLFMVGEAMTQIRRLEPRIADSLGPSEQIIAFRNILAHGYFFVDHSMNWRIVEVHVPVLLDNARALLATLPRPEEIE